MGKIKQVLLAIAISITTLLLPTHFALADSYTVPMQILENGSSNTSYAAAYFAGSATVTPSDNGYTVTSTITTDTSLGDYPVQMLSIDGAGVAIAKSQTGNNQTITYTFQTNNLTARHNANIRVDVDSINYHHNYTVGLVIDGSSVPAPQKTAVAPSASSQATATTQASASTESVASTTATDASSHSETVAPTSSDSSSSMSSSDKKKTTTSKKDATPKQVTSETPLPIAAIIGGGLVIGIAGAVALNLSKKK